MAKKIAFFAIPIIDFAIADRTAIFWQNDNRRWRKKDRRSRSAIGHDLKITTLFYYYYI